MWTKRPVKGWLVVRMWNGKPYPFPKLYPTQVKASDARHAMLQTDELKYFNLAVVAQR